MKYKAVLIIALLFTFNNTFAHNDFWCLQHAAQPNKKVAEQSLLINSRIAKRNGDVLTINTKNGPKIYKNGRYPKIYAGSYKISQQQKFALVRVGLGFELINLKSGEILIVNAHPLFSMDNKRFIDFSMALDNSDLYNRIRVYKLTSNGIVKEWEYQYKDAERKGPSNPNWLNNSSFVFFETSSAEATCATTVRTPVIVERENNKWSNPIPLK